MAHELGALLLVSWEIASYDSLESLGVLLRDAIPEFGCAEMKVINRVEIGIFNVPGDYKPPISA